MNPQNSHQSSNYNQPNQQSYQYQQPTVQHVVHHHSSPKSAGAAVALEMLPGFFFQTFGIGQMYAGNVGLGLAFMFGYWFVLFINIVLCFILIGLLTLPLCWIAMMIFSPILAASAANKRNY